MAQMSALISFTPNTTILSADVNSNFTTIRSTYNAHDSGTTAVHGVGTGTVAYWLSTGDFGVDATDKIFLDGRAGSGNTYIYESASDVMRLVVGGANALSISTTLLTIDARDAAIDTTKKFYFDGGNNSYMYEASGDDLQIVAGGNANLRVTTTGVEIGSSANFYMATTKRIYFNQTTSNTAIYEAAANDLRIVSGGNENIKITTSGVEIGDSADLYVATAKRLYFNKTTATTSIYESASNVIRIVTNSTNAISISSSAVTIDARTFAVDTTKNLYYDGGSDTYTVESSGDTLDTYVGGSLITRKTTSGVTISTGDLTISDGQFDLTDTSSSGTSATFTKTFSSDSNLGVLSVSGSNAGAGGVAGLSFAGTMDWCINISAGNLTSAATVSSLGGVLKALSGSTTYYIPLYTTIS